MKARKLQKAVKRLALKWLELHRIHEEKRHS